MEQINVYIFRRHFEGYSHDWIVEATETEIHNLVRNEMDNNKRVRKVEISFANSELVTHQFDSEGQLWCRVKTSEKPNVLRYDTRQLNGATQKLLDGHMAIFVRQDGSQQTFKVVNGVLKELKRDGRWKERVYLPRWDALKNGKWIY